MHGAIATLVVLIVLVGLIVGAGVIMTQLARRNAPPDSPPPPEDTPLEPDHAVEGRSPALPELPPLADDPLAAPEPETGTVAGAVATEDGTPFSGPFTVHVLSADSGDLPEVSSMTVPAGDGTFEVANVRAGRYVVAVEAGSLRGACDPVTVHPSRPVRGVWVVIRPAGSVSGVVLRLSTGGPIADAVIRCEEQARNVPSARSDADGRFRIGGLPVGETTLTVRREGFAAGLVEDLEIEEGRETTGLVIRLGVGGTIRGVVFGPDGTPSPGAKVVIVPVLEGMRILGDLGPTVVADESGAYRIDHLTPGRYRVRRPAGGSAPVVLIDDEPNPDAEDDPALEVGEGGVVVFDVRTDSTGTISGTMRSKAGVPLRRQVSVLDADGRAPAEGERPRFVLPEENGEFILSDLPPADYVLESDGVRTPVTVRPGQTSEVEIVFDTCRVEGVVTDETGVPLAGAKLWLHRQTEFTLRVRVEVTPAAETDANGRFAFADATPGAYRVQVQNGPATAQTGVFELRPGEVRKGIVVRLKRTVEVRILVQNASGDPIPGVPVQLSAQEGKTDADGVAFLNASPGIHLIVAGTLPDAIGRTVLVQKTGPQTFRITLE